MTKILVGECKQEVSSFNPMASYYDDFEISHEADLVLYHQGLQSEMGGALATFAAYTEVQIVPTYSARAITSGGTLATPDFERMRRDFAQAVWAAGPVDGVYLSLHGAMAAADEDDPEGVLLADLRRIVGEAVPVVVSLDLHAILTDRMLRHADAVVAYHTYPHVDFYETGVRAARLLMAILREGVRPVTARVKIPALVRGDQLITETGLFGHLIQQAQALENGPAGLSAGYLIGNPFTDVVDLRTNSFVVTDNDPQRAKREALRLAADFWQIRHELQVRLTSLADALAIADTVVGTVILVDAADATSSGASGDSNFILRGLMDAGYEGRCLLPIVDPEAVAAAAAAGIGRTVRTTVGGKLDTLRFQPLPIEATVEMLSTGRFPSESHGATWYAGPCAVLQAGAITIVASSRAVSLYDRSLFLAHGQDPARFDLVVVKSPHCQPRFYADWAARLIDVDAPGSTSANLRSLGHSRCRRPIFPLDDDVVFAGEVDLFNRATR